MLKTIVHHILVRHGRFLDNDAKQGPLSLQLFSGSQCFTKIFATNFPAPQTTPAVAARLHFIGMKLKPMRLLSYDVSRQLIQEKIKVINLPLEYGYARKHEVLFVPVRYRTRIIDIE